MSWKLKGLGPECTGVEAVIEVHGPTPSPWVTNTGSFVVRCQGLDFTESTPPELVIHVSRVSDWVAV